MQTHTHTSAIVGMTLAPLFFAVQAQAFQTPTPVVQVAATKTIGSERRVRITHGAILSLNYDVRRTLGSMSDTCENLSQAISATLEQIAKGEEVEFSHSMTSMAASGMQTLQETMAGLLENFEIILSRAPAHSICVIDGLKKDTLAGMQEVVNIMSKIGEIEAKLQERETTVVVIDQDRMRLAIESPRIFVDKKLSREEKRRLILQHAS